MSSVKTGNTGHKKLQPGMVILGENGMPVDAIATISGTYVLLKGVGVLSYSIGMVTTPIGTDLTDILNAMPRYTGKYILLTNDGSMWFIDRQSINTVARTFKIYTNDTNVSSPAVIDLTAGWSIAEVEIINRLATTSMAKIDQVEFRDMQFQFSIDGDKVGVQGTNGNTLEPNVDGSINIGGVVNVDTDLTAVENKLDTLISEAQAANLTLDSIETNVISIDTKLDTANTSLDAIEASTSSIDTKLTQTNLELSAANASLDNLEVKVDTVNANLSNIEADTASIDTNTSQTNVQLVAVNASLDAIEAVLAAPLNIVQPILTAGTSSGLPAGPVFVQVNNLKNQILATHDRDQAISYAAFGTKDQRITQIDYTSPQFPGTTARKTMTYVVDGGQYKRTNITWTIV